MIHPTVQPTIQPTAITTRKHAPGWLWPVLLAGATFVLSLGLLLYFHQAIAWLGGWGYVSVFFIELINSATIIMPTPGRAFTIAQAITLYPMLIGVLAGVGSSIGELTGYFAGRKGREAIAGNRFINWIEARWERGADPIVFIGALLPLPFDVIGLWAGAARYPVTRFLAYSTPAKIVKMTVLAYAAHYGLGWVIG